MLLLLFLVRMDKNIQIFMFLKTFKHCIVYHMKSNYDIYEMLKYSYCVSNMLFQAETTCMKIFLEKIMLIKGGHLL